MRSAAASIAFDSMKSPPSRSALSSSSTSRRSSASPSHALSRNVSRSPDGQSTAAWNTASIRRHRSGFIRLALADGAVEPCLRRAPLALDRSRRDAEHGGDLLGREAAEELHLDDLALARVHLREAAERAVERDHLRRLASDARRLPDGD